MSNFLMAALFRAPAVSRESPRSESRITILTCDNVDHAVGEAQRLVELLGALAHLFLHGATLLQVALHHHELLHLRRPTATATATHLSSARMANQVTCDKYLFELMDSEDSPCIFSVRAGFFPEAG